jgi:uncharacterized protein
VDTPQASPPLARLDEPLDDDELDTLADEVESTGRKFEWATGFLTALVTGPELVPPSGWLPVVMGEDLSAHSNAGETIGRAMRWYNGIVATLSRDDATVCPPPSDHEACKAFCDGYLGGSTWHPQWRSDDTAIALVLPMGVLSGQIDPSELRDENGRPMEDVEEAMQEFRDDLPFYVHELRDHWAARRAASGQPKKPKVGRNEPCPCGSGKKYKKCCLQ